MAEEGKSVLAGNADSASDTEVGDSKGEHGDNGAFTVLICVDQSHHSEDAFRSKYIQLK